MVFFSLYLWILIGWWYGKLIISKNFKLLKKFDVGLFDDLITYLILSIILGGRLGYVFFYNLGYYIENPLDILKVWEGGMSFHGAMLGIIIGTYIFSKKRDVKTFFFLILLLVYRL